MSKPDNLTKRGRTLTAGVREMVVKLHAYFELECQNNGPILPVNQVQARVSHALGISKRTITNILKEKYGPSGIEDNVLQTPRKRRRRIKSASGSTLPIPEALRNLSVKKPNNNKMVDPKRVVSYEDMLKVIHQPEKVIIDVRNPDEVSATGKIPSSINIPLNTVQDALMSMSDDEFKKHFQRRKPNSSDELIFYCQSGRRSSEALDKALKLGYSNSKTYLGSWNDWSSRQK